MRVGAKSLLFGVHLFVWHPITVFIAWVYLYGSFPNWKESVCILIHDWGYWFSSSIDGESGQVHPTWAANKAMRWFGPRYYHMCLYHSRHYAKKHNQRPSKLCWADKMSFLFDPRGWYLLRAKLSGELEEFRLNAHRSGAVRLSESHRTWHAYLTKVMRTLAEEKRGDAVPYVDNGGKK